MKGGLSQDSWLTSGEIELVGRVLDATNATYLVEVGMAAGPVRRAIYKPIRGERPLSDFPVGTLANRERAAYLLSEATGWRIVPLTVLRNGPLGPGMVQEWVDEDVETDILALLQASDERLRRIAVFDVLANNADRKGGHLIPVPDGHVHGVDHGICFSAQPKLRTILWAWRGQPLNEEELSGVERVSAALAGDLGGQLRQLLSAAEVEATVGRARTLLDQPRFPHPDSTRPAIPWPPF
ncbi:MAG TPA: SCO1664 family protein [Candidatus Limnocylindrales bacterium]|nr:SCO1664 family protein [Candidatus Limnocylindrales bacterium]